MSSRSSLYTVLYVLAGTILVCTYAYGLMPNILEGVGIERDLGDVITTLFLFGLGLLAIGFGADLPIVVVTGSLGAFVALTLNQPPLIRYMSLGAMLFAIGLYGMVVSRNAVRVLMSIELMLSAVNINLVALAHYIDPQAIRGQVFAVFILTVAAAEAAVGLAIVLAIYRNMSTVDMEKFNLLKW